MVRVEQVTTKEGIDRLVPEWRSLWQRVANATPFQSPEWLLSWWECFGNSAPSVVTARNGDQLIGVLPLYLLEEPGCRKLLPFGISLSDYLDALLDPAHQGLCEALLRSLADIGGWDECYLPELPPSAALLAAQCPAALSEQRSSGETCPVLSLPGAVEELREVVPRKTLRDLRQARGRAAAAGTLTVSRADGATVSAFMHEFFRLHECRWQRVAGQGVCADPMVQRFHLAAAERMCGAGMLRLHLLRIGDGPAVGAYYGFIAKGNAYAYLSGFDPDRADVSPGTQIVGHAIEEAVREGAREFHFLRGGEAYKYAWGAVDRPNTALTLRRKC
jgi:CelD/BcsL family acetyltransferase involved in cellulose biosynthesis